MAEKLEADAERVRLLIAQVEAGQFDELDAVADQWSESAGVVQMMNAIASVFEKHASQDIMDRFRSKLASLMHLAFVEGAAQGLLQVKPLTATPDRSDDALAEERVWQPIETAPRDGTEFLALVSNGWYALVSAPAEALREGWPYQWWRSNDRQSYPVVDTHSADSEWGDRLLLTHWMALPPAPRAALKGDGL